MNKVLTLWLAVLMVLTVAVTMLVSCHNPNQDDEGGNTTIIPGEGDEDRIPLDVPNKNYEVNGEKTQYHILEWAAGGQNAPGQSWVPWEEGDVEAEDGDMLGSAVFRRNAWVEQQFGVEITKEYCSVDGNPSFKTRVFNDASTTSNEFQLMTLRTLNIIELIQEDLYLDMNLYKDTILHTDQPWWVQDAVRSFTLGSHLYVTSSEMLLRDKGATSTLYFNQYLAKDYEEDLPNFFELVDNMEWTVDRMIDACEVVAHPNDGDDEINTTGDVWGISGGDDTVYYLYNSYGYKFAHIDDFGYIEYDFGKGNTITVMQDIFLNVMYGDFYFNTYVMRDMLEEGQNIFVDGNALFSSALVKDTTTKMKNMEDLYGILPHPMLDEDQEAYFSLVWVHHDSSLGIPRYVADPEMCAIILEALSWESYYSVSPIFYDTILYNRAAKDEDSKRMLKVIFDARSYDPGQYYDSGSNPSGLHGDEGLLRLTSKGNADIAGKWAQFGGAAEENMREVNNWIAGNED